MTHPPRTDGIRIRYAAACFGWAALLAPLGVVLHELGHYVVAICYGFPVRLNPASVTGGARLGEADAFVVGLQAVAGPAVSLVLTLAACWLIATRGARPAFVMLALTAPLRIIVAAVYFGARLATWLQGGEPGTPNFDEYNLAAAWGLPLDPILIAFILFLVAVWIWTIGRIARGRRLIALGAGAGGTALGLATWFNLAGPALLR